MTTTPTVWKPEYRLNLFTNTLQADAAIVDIGGGRIIAFWTDYDNSVADTGGVNLVGRISMPREAVSGARSRSTRLQEPGFSRMQR